MAEWCVCPNEFTSGHVSLTPVAGVWVHGECLKPSREWWEAYAGDCLNCGRRYSNPVEDFCAACLGDSSVASWAAIADCYRRLCDVRDAHFYMTASQEKLPEHLHS